MSTATSRGNCTLQFDNLSVETDLRILGNRFDKKTAVGAVATVPGYYSPWDISIFTFMTSLVACERFSSLATRE
jgi:hypothetical protein